jgi:hypothetical protein
VEPARTRGFTIPLYSLDPLARTLRLLNN